MPHQELTARDLARITLRVAAVATLAQGKEDLDLSFGRTREVYAPLAEMKELKALLPFSEREWDVICDADLLWSEMKSQLGIHDERVRITLPAAHVPIEEWNRHMVTSVAHTLCFGQAMHAFKIID